MVRALLLASLAAALIVAVGGYLLGRRDPSERGGPPRLTPTEILAVLLPLIGFAVTLPSHGLFSAGQGLGRGFLLGGLGALAFGFGTRGRSASASGPVALALPVICVTVALLFLRAVLLDALMGIGIGWFAVTFLLYVARRGESPQRDAALAASAGFAATLAAASVIGTLRDALTPELAKGTWCALLVSFAAAGALVSLIAGTFRGSAPRAHRIAAAAIAGIGVTAAVAALLGTKAVSETRLTALLVAGLLGYPLLNALQPSNGGDPESGVGRNRVGFPMLIATSAPYLGVVLLVTALMVGGQLLGGLGYGLVLVALYVGWAIFGDSGDPRRARLLLFGAVLVLYRAFSARWNGDLHGVNLSDQYAVFGLVVGLATPGLTAALFDGVGWGRARAARPLIASVVGALLTLAVPACVLLLFGAKCALALLLGSALGGVSAETLLPLLFAIAVGLAMDQWSDRLLAYADLSRLVKIKALGVVLALVLAAVAAASSRRPSTGETAARDQPL